MGRVPDVDVKVPGSAIQIKTDTKVVKLKQSKICDVSRLNIRLIFARMISVVRAFSLPCGEIGRHVRFNP